jgi:tRNA A37 threonylcarbamoyladenosine biosynthesis protein TsaE
MAEAPKPPSDWLIDYTPQRSLPLDQEALRVFEYAYRVGQTTEKDTEPRVTFTTLLIALMEGTDDTSRWFAQLVATLGPDPVKVFAEKSFDKTKLEGDTPFPLGPANPALSSDRQLLTKSAHEVLKNAEQRAYQVGGSDIGVRHLVASYVLNPPAWHRAQMQGWQFQESRWRSEFFPWIAARYTAEQWIDASQRPAPTQAIPTFEEPKISGAALAFPGDESTLAILDKASQFHSRRQDEWLRLQTVFYALFETAREDAEVGAAVQPICDAIDLIGPQYESARDAFVPTSASEDPATSFSELDISPRVLNALEAARDLAAATWRDHDGEFRVSALHLAGALISRRADGDAELSTLGLNPLELRLELIDYAQKKGQSGDTWREALGEEEGLQAGRPVDLNSDEPEAVVRLDEDWKSDPLLIRPDVEAFAALLASKDLEPPLSIGLFGPWGSGKTTFLRRLQRAVKRRANEAQTAAKNSQKTSYVSNVVHVDFNAWHFAEDALTSSLVDTILREMSSYIKLEQPTFGDEWSKLKLEQLETTKRTLEAAEAVKAAAQKAVTDAEAALAAAQNKTAEVTTGLQAVVQAVWTTTKTALQSAPEVKDSGVLEAVGNTVKTSAELQAKLNSIRTRPARLLSDLGWGRTLLFAAMVLVLPALVGWIVRTITGQGGQEVITAITTLLVVVGGWLRTATQAVSKVDQAIARVAEEYENRIAADPSVRQAQKNLDAAQVNATTAELGVQSAREALAKAQAAAANATLPAQMLQLVSSRIEDKTYNKELTTLSLARADLQALSKILGDQNKTANPPAGDPSQPGAAPVTPPIRTIERVILYIDDLDRCKPADVVRVLQLVHMLLAFELFVVVVAVDARWIEESLMDSYKWLAGSDGAKSLDSSTNGYPRRQPATGRVTPQDYLEKIFQISFWLEPMTPVRAERYLASLVRTQPRQAVPVIGVPTEGSAAESKIEIEGIELDYMRALAAYVGPSPRRVKRLVNAYRLIKARLSNAQLEKFLTKRETEDGHGKSGPYQLVIGLLVIATGAHSTSAQILRELSECDPADSPEDVVERFRDRNHPDWIMAAKVIEFVMRTQKANDVSELRGWASNVGRFLLNSPTGVITPVTHPTPPVADPMPLGPTEVQQPGPSKTV